MAFLPAALPWIATAAAGYGQLKQGQADTYNSQVAANERNLSINQANAQEGLVRRGSREALAKQAAAFGAAGVGYGGSSETALDQSAINQEMDALNTRYKGAITGYGYGVESSLYKDKAKSSNLLAGAALLKGLGSNYSYAPRQPSTSQNDPSLQPTPGYS
jgi:hypothetical protein